MHLKVTKVGKHLFKLYLLNQHLQMQINIKGSTGKLVSYFIFFDVAPFSFQTEASYLCIPETMEFLEKSLAGCH